MNFKLSPSSIKTKIKKMQNINNKIYVIYDCLITALNILKHPTWGAMLQSEDVDSAAAHVFIFFILRDRKYSHYCDVHEYCRAAEAFIGGLKDENSIYMWQRSSDVRVFEQDFKRAAATHLEKLKPP